VITGSVIGVENLAILLLAIVSGVALIASKTRIPYTVALVLVGLAITLSQQFKTEVSPDIILSIFIPPIAFEAGYRIDFARFRANWRQILMLAIPGVVITMLVIGVVLNGLGVAGLTAAMVFGALISATDPVAVLALFGAFDLSPDLEMIIESESLLNDGTAIVVFNIALAIALGGTFSLGGGIVDFVRVSAGGVLVGGILGFVIARILAQIDDYLVETALTTCLAFGAYLIADQFHVSGVLAVVTAGILAGNLGIESMSPTTRIVARNFWEFIAYIANSLVFLLIGMAIQLSDLIQYARAIGAAILAVLVSRAIVVYGLSFLLNRTRGKVPNAWQHVLFWGGLRGAISLALALSLPTALTDRASLRAMTFGVVLFTILVQGTTMETLLKRLNLIHRDPRIAERDERFGRLYAAEAAWNRMRQLHTDGLIVGELWEEVLETHRIERERLAAEMHALYMQHDDLHDDVLRRVRRETLLAQRAALNDAMQRSLISAEAGRKLIAEIDHNIDALH
jgi:CPA1 family monovalent cation:H+ antiporter